MNQQMSFAQAEYAGKRKITRRERFLGEMERMVPWARLVRVIEPYYPKGERGRPPIGLERMLRIYFLQQWYALADEALEDALYDSQAMRTFAGIDLSVEAVPDATTLLNFRHLLEAHHLTQAIFAEVGALLRERKLLMREGTIVDATIIAAPSSTKNKRQERDPEMHQTRKGHQWYFGMKAHIGVDAQSGLLHRVTGTAANVADIAQTSALLHGEEKKVHADAGYQGVEKRAELIGQGGAMVCGRQTRPGEGHGGGKTQGTYPGLREGQSAGARSRRASFSHHQEPLLRAGQPGHRKTLAAKHCGRMREPGKPA